MREDRTAIGSGTSSDVDVPAGEKVRLKPPKEPSPNLSMHGGAASSDGLGARLGLRLGKGSSRAHRLGASSSSGGSSSGAAKGEDSASTESRPGGHRASPSTIMRRGLHEAHFFSFFSLFSSITASSVAPTHSVH